MVYSKFSYVITWVFFIKLPFITLFLRLSLNLFYSTITDGTLLTISSFNFFILLETKKALSRKKKIINKDTWFIYFSIIFFPCFYTFKKNKNSNSKLHISYEGVAIYLPFF